MAAADLKAEKEKDLEEDKKAAVAATAYAQAAVLAPIQGVF